MKIKNLYYSVSAIAMALLLSVTGFSTNVEASSQKEPKISTSSESKKRTPALSTTGSVNQKNGEALKAGEIKVVNIYDPTTEKKETYFFTLLNTLDTKKENAIKSAQTLFGDTAIKKYLVSDKTVIDKDYARYQSVFDEDCYCCINSVHATYQDGEYVLAASNEDIFLSNENGARYTNITQIVTDAETTYEFCESAFFSDASNTIHTNDEQIKIEMIDLTRYGYEPDETLGLDKLEEIKNNINEKCNAKNQVKSLQTK